MQLDSLFRSPMDIVALAFFLGGWMAFALAVQGRIIKRTTLTRAMDLQREAWMRAMARRELRMIDTSIINGLQQGTAFFASTCILAVGGCFALLGSSDQVLAVLGDLSADQPLQRPIFEAKVFGLIALLSYAFFKFGWSYRLFNYCSILIGAVPVLSDMRGDAAETEAALLRAAKMNILAGRHFNAGLRAIFFSLGYIGWFIGPWVFIATTTCIIAVLVRRQFFSKARLSVLDTPGL